MTTIKSPKIEERTAFLNHKAVYDHGSKTWNIDDSLLNNDDKLFFLRKGIKVKGLTNLWIMYYLSEHDFFKFRETEQLQILSKLYEPNENEDDMDIPFYDFVRITKVFQHIDEDHFYDICAKALTDDSKDKRAVLDNLHCSELEKALFFYNFYK